MSVTKIYYHNWQNDETNIFREGELYDKGYVFTKCPVFNHKSNRTFVVFSPFDLTLNFDKQKIGFTCEEFSYDSYKELSLEELLFCDEEHKNSPLPVLQFCHPSFAFWTEEPNVWIEYKDHPMTSLNNNFVGMGAWWNLSNHPRMISNAITIVDIDKPVVIKKGDPLCRICFYPQDLNSGIILEEKFGPKIKEKFFEMHKEKKQKKVSLSSLFSIKSCPFKFLYDR